MSISILAHAPSVGRRFLTLMGALVAGSLLVFGIALHPSLAYSEILAAAIVLATLPLGAALFAAIGVCMGATWWQPLHGVFTYLARLIVVPAVAGGVILAVGAIHIYSWTDPVVAAGHVVHQKVGWLNLWFFWGRSAAVILLWIWMCFGLSRRIQTAVEQPSAKATARMVRSGIIFVILFGITISVAWWDWLMSIEPEWFSTMQGVYGFSCAFLGGIALVTAVALIWEKQGRLKLTDGQLHDLGKMLFAFSFFWGYIWFCQFMLIWYSNIPEESAWFVHRLSGSWATYFVLNLVISFGLPFVLLLSAGQKKNRPLLFQVAVLVLAGRALDIWLSITPSIESTTPFPIYGLAALFLLGVLTFGAKFNLGRR